MNIKFFSSNHKDEIKINWNFENLIPNKGDIILIDDEKQPKISVNDVITEWNTITNVFEYHVYTSFNNHYGQY